MQKKLVNTSFIYAIAAILAGAIYREFTKFINFSGDTRLSIVHTHIFMLGMVVMLFALVFDKLYNMSDTKLFKKFYTIYNIAFIGVIATFIARGLMDIYPANMSKVIDMSISGVAGISHILLTVGFVFFFLSLKESIKQS